MDIVFEALKKIPGITDTEAHEAANKINRQEGSATKTDLLEVKTELIDRAAKLETRLVWGIVAAVGIILTAIKYF